MRRSKELLLRAARSIGDRLFFLEAERIVRNRTPEQQEAIRRYHEAATNRVALADASTDPWYAPAAVALHREAIRFLVTALRISLGDRLPGPPMDLAEALSALDELVRSGPSRTPPRYRNARTILETPDYLTFAEHDAVERARGRADVESLVTWLRRSVEPRSLPRLWMARAGRILLAVIAVGVLVRYGVRR